MVHRLRNFGRRRTTTVLCALSAVAVIVSSTPPSASADLQAGLAGGIVDFQDEVAGTGDVDARTGAIAPTPEQQQAAADLGARVSWTAFGTPALLTPTGAALGAPAKGDAPTVARSWLRTNRDLFRLSEAAVDDLELLLDAPIGSGHAVTFRQRFDGLPAASDGLVTFGVAGDSVIYLSSSVSASLAAGASVATATLSTQQAYVAAAAGTGRRVRAADVRANGEQAGWTRLQVTGVSQPQYTRVAALPTPRNGVRVVYDTLVFDTAIAAAPVGMRVLVDGVTGQVWLRDNLVEHYEDPGTDPQWSVFPGAPPLDYSSRDTRQQWCFTPARGCDRVLASGGTGQPWDIDPSTGAPSTTSTGNNARSTENWNSASAATVGTTTASPAPDRRYSYPWTNQWQTAGCDPATMASPQRNDIDAALANLFVQHNRMHDWAYHLGFTEQTFNAQVSNAGLGGAEADPEQGNAQAGGIAGGPPNPPSSRNNANQITPPDGIAPITNMYLWQPLAGSFYAPCVDGDYDQSVIGHEYTHAITNRMIAGPDRGYSGPQGGAMGESWSDLFSIEYLNEYGLAADPRNPYAVGAYVTGDRRAAIRNYSMDDSPLNYSDVAYDLSGQEVHSDGEIWNATNFALRQALVRKYDRRFPAGDRRLQAACADGLRAVESCPGNRRWIQLQFDSLLLMQSAVSFVDARDALLAADQLRFGGANAADIWNVFASRGVGEGAASNTNADADPLPDFTSPQSAEGTVSLEPVDGGAPIAGAQLFVGAYEARAVPIADTDPETGRASSAGMVPGRYAFVVQAPGYGMRRLTAEVRAGQTTRVRVTLPRNLASAHNGAVASGDGVNQASLIDDTEATNWAALGAPVAGRTVTVALDPARDSYRIDRVQVSAMTRPTNTADPGGDTAAQSRFSAVRQFQLWTCVRGTGVDCTQDTQFRLAYTSPRDAFPAIAPRPRAPQLTTRSFDIPDTRASVVRLRVLTNQCTGTPDYAGERDSDPNNATDCATASPQANNVRVAELQVFTQ